MERGGCSGRGMGGGATNVGVPIFACAHVHPCARTHTVTDAHAHIYTHMHTHTRSHARTSTHAPTCKHSLTFTKLPPRTHTRGHPHAQGTHAHTNTQ